MQNPRSSIDRGKNTEEGARTLDPWIHNPMLYQLSYLGIDTNANTAFYDTHGVKQRTGEKPRNRRTEEADLPLSVVMTTASSNNCA